MTFDHISINTQSSIRIEGSKILYFDPFERTESAHDADYIFLTHDHFDHFDKESLKNVAKKDSVIVVPTRMEKQVREIFPAEKIITMEVRTVKEIDGLEVKAVPAYNRMKPFHLKKNGWLGYVVTMDGVRYYAAGDTDDLQELREVSCDVAFVPIGGKFTMNAKEAAGIVNAIRPAAVIPIHYGSIVGKRTDADELRKYTDPDIPVIEKLY